MSIPRKVLENVAHDLKSTAETFERSARKALSPLVRDVFESMSHILMGAAWAMTESAEGGSPMPAVELADHLTDWLLARRVGAMGLTIDQLATDPETN